VVDDGADGRGLCRREDVRGVTVGEPGVERRAVVAVGVDHDGHPGAREPRRRRRRLVEVGDDDVGDATGFEQAVGGVRGRDHPVGVVDQRQLLVEGRAGCDDAHGRTVESEAVRLERLRPRREAVTGHLVASPVVPEVGEDGLVDRLPRGELHSYRSPV
jgi:hypothetical protein